MTVLDLLAAHGFQNAEVLPDNHRGKIVVKVLTKNGWDYQRFEPDSLADQIARWVAGRRP